jgi:hypothetical protein
LRTPLAGNRAAVEFDRQIVQRGLQSRETFGQGDRYCAELWRRVADDLWDWLIRTN